MCTQLFPLSSGSYSSKRDTFYVKWQPEASNDGKTSKNPNERNCHLQNYPKSPPFELNK